MGNKQVRIEIGSGFAGLPHLDDHQRVLLQRMMNSDAVLRGAPGSGKTTLLLSAVAELVRQGRSFLVLTPDRSRADALMPAVQSMAPDTVRPVRTPTAWAYSIVSQWRNTRDEPLGDVELLTGASIDRLITQLLETTTLNWPEELSQTIQALPAFKMELRYLIDLAAEAGLAPDRLAELGQTYSIPQWETVAFLLRKWQEIPELAVEYRGTMQAHGAALGRSAARLLLRWDQDIETLRLRGEIPLPQCILIDDLQDCTPSLLPLLQSARQYGTQIIAFSNPDVSVTSYKRGYANLDLDLAKVLGVDIDDCGGSYHSTPQLHELNLQISSNITQSGPISRRLAPFLGRTTDTETPVQIHSCASSAQMGAAIGYALRSHHLHDDIPWSRQLVLVRSQSLIQQARRALKRSYIPLAGGQQAFNFAANSMTSALLTSLIPHSDSAAQLIDLWLRSDLISIDTLHVRSAIQNYVWAHSETVRDGVLSQHLTTEMLSRILADSDSLPQHVETELRKLLTASSLWKESPGLSAEEGLWKAWETADVAQALSDRALAQDADSDYYDDVLDAVIALFRVADIWQQRNPQGSAADFAAELLQSDVPIDTIARTALRREGVHVLTPEQAMGKHWDTVAIYGLQDGSWPDLRLGHRLLRGDLLTDILRLDSAGNGSVPSETTPLLDDPRIQRRAILDNELRRLLAATSRATRFLHIGVVSNEDQAPSQFVELIAKASGIEIPEEGFTPEEVPPSLDLSGHVARLRFLATQEDDETRELAANLLALLAQRGVHSAQPDTWIGAGGISSDSAIYGQQNVSISPSSFDTARACILRWFFSVNSGSSVPTQSAADGTLIHSLAERFPHGPKQAVVKALEEEIQAMDLDEEPAATKIHLNHLRDMASALGEYLEGSTGEVRVEVPFDVPVSSVNIRGRMDRLEVSGESVRIIDFKTGKKGAKGKIKTDPDHPQLALYQLAAEELGYTIIDAELKYLGYGDVRTILQEPLDDDTKNDWISQLDEVASRMRGPHFIATPSDEACRYCEFTRSCPAKDQGKRSVE